MRRRAIALLAACALAVAFVAPASAAVGVIQGPVPLVGPRAAVWCDSGDPFFPGDVDLARAPGPGGIIYMASDSMVGGLVTLKGAAPMTRYVVRFIQATPDPAYWFPQCHGVDGYIWTDGSGNGSLYVRESRIPSAVALQVIVDTGAVYKAPTYRASAKFELTPLAPYVPGPVGGPATVSRSSNHR